MLQEASGSLPPKDTTPSSPVWEGEVLEKATAVILGLAFATKARAVFVRGYENWNITPLDTSTGKIDNELLPPNYLEVHFLNRGTNRNRRGLSRWNAVYEAEDKWAQEHPQGPTLDLTIHFARDHFSDGSRINWEDFAHQYGLKSDQHLQIWPPQPT